MKTNQEKFGIRFQLKSLAILFGFGLMSCTEVRFNQPLPEVAQQEKEFPLELQGNYVSKRIPNESMVVSKDEVMNYNLKTVLFVKGNQNEGLTLLNNQLFEKGNTMPYRTFNLGDTLLGVQTESEKTVVLDGKKFQLKKMDGFYFLNQANRSEEGGLEGYEVFMFKKNGKELEIYAISTAEGVKLLEKTAKIKVENGKVVKGSVTNQELKKFIQLGGFSIIESFTQVK